MDQEVLENASLLLSMFCLSPAPWSLPVSVSSLGDLRLSQAKPRRAKVRKTPVSTCLTFDGRCRSLQNSCNSYQFTQALLIILHCGTQDSQGRSLLSTVPSQRAPGPLRRASRALGGGRDEGASGFLPSSQPELPFPAGLHSRFCLKKQYLNFKNHQNQCIEQTHFQFLDS